MFRSRFTLEEYLKSVEHEVAAGEDMSLDDLDMVIDLEEDNDDDVEVNEQDDLDSNVFANVNPAHISIPEDFKDDQEVLIIDERGNAKKSKGRVSVHMVYKLVPPERIMVPLNNLLQPIKKAGSLFNRFIADIAKRSSLCPLNYDDWRLVPQYFKGRIIMYIRKMFMLPDGVEVNRKILSAVGEKVRGYKYSLRCKYVKEDTTKEALYHLDISKRPSNISDQMWVGLVDHFFSDKFQKFSKNGKMARGKQLHPHTGGSESFAIKRDKFETEHQREPGPIEWFVKTRERKDHSYHEPVTQKFVDCAVGIIKKKTGSSEVEFSEATVAVETHAYHKLMGPERNGRVRGVGNGVAPGKLHGRRNCQSGMRTSDSNMMSLLLKEVQTLRKEVAYLKSRPGEAKSGELDEDNTINSSLHGENVRSNSHTESSLLEIENSSILVDKGDMRQTSGLQMSQHARYGGGKENVQLNSIRGNNFSSKMQMGKKPYIAPSKEQNTTMLGDEGVIQNMNTPQVSHSANFMGAQRDVLDNYSSGEVNINSMLRQDQIKQGKRSTIMPNGMLGDGGIPQNLNRHQIPRVADQHNSTLLKAPNSSGGVKLSEANEKTKQQRQTAAIQDDMPYASRMGRLTTCTGAESQTCKASVEMPNKQRVHMQHKQNPNRPPPTLLGRVEIEKLVDKVLKDNPDTVRSFKNPRKRDFAHCYLGGSAMTECKRRADPELLDKILWEKLFATIKPVGLDVAERTSLR